MHAQPYKDTAIAASLFLAAFFLVPYSQLAGLSMMPGDLGDARLNNYFLENIYQYLLGNSNLVELKFFFPFPHVLGFSDNLFGAAPIYLLARVLTGHSDTAFQIWYLAGYLANYVACYYVLRRMGCSVIAASVGSLVFSFSLPVTANIGHSQLHYRFGVPLAALCFTSFLLRKDWWQLLLTAAWLVWQFYCSVYIGFFASVLLAAMLVAYLISSRSGRAPTLKQTACAFAQAWRDLERHAKRRILILGVLLLVLLIALFYPYLEVTMLYRFKRGWGEIAAMLPRPGSYLLSDESLIWAPFSALFDDIPVRHEHQMFIGIVPLLLASVGAFCLVGEQLARTRFIQSASIVLIFIATLYVGGFSLWYLFAKFPVASSIRAMARISLILLFPVALLCAIAIDRIRIGGVKKALVLALIIVPLIAESAATRNNVSSKAEWRERIALKNAALPDTLPKDAIVFMGQGDDVFYRTEIDAMWVALNRGVATMNGYSGWSPPDYEMSFGNECGELPARILSYLRFTGTQNESAYKSIVDRVIPVGLKGCKPQWWQSMPVGTAALMPYPPEEVRKISIEYLERTKVGDRWDISLKLSKAGTTPISARSAVDMPISLAWRALAADGSALTEFNNRTPLAFDIPGDGSMDMTMKLALPDKPICFIEITMVQEFRFWAYDIGMPPLRVDWDCASHPK